MDIIIIKWSKVKLHNTSQHYVSVTQKDLMRIIPVTVQPKMPNVDLITENIKQIVI